MNIPSTKRRVWAEIDLEAIDRNYSIIRGLLKPETKLCCVVKANAYGHGAEVLARHYEKLGADWFAVSNIEEALQLRDAGVTVPVLVLGYTPADCIKALANNDISTCVFDLEYAKALSENAVREGAEVKIHIKVDTGMSRLGFTSVSEMEEVCRLPGLIPEGIFTHFAVADTAGQEDFTRLQFARFTGTVSALEASGVSFSVRHCANSAAILDYPEFQLDMVRAGAILYGIAPSSEIKNKPGFMPAMTLRSVISQIKTVPAGTDISYGRTFTTKRDTVVATVPIGYADGLPRSSAGRGVSVTVGGVACPILGRICMDQLMVDAGAVPGLSRSSEVVIFGRAPAPTADEIAEKDGTIGYELVCNIGRRVPRIYK